VTGREVALEARPDQEAITGVHEMPGPRVPVVTELPGLRVTSPAPRSAWRELLAADADALVSQSPEWLDALCAGGSHEDASRLYEGPRGRLLLPLVRRRGPWPSRLAPRASMPHAWGVGGLLASGPPTMDELASVAADLASDPAMRTSIRPNPLHADLWASASSLSAVAIPRRAHVLDLSDGAEGAWRGCRKRARHGVRKAERRGVEVECDTTGRLVPVFHRLLQLSIERWAAQQHEPLPLARWRGRRRDPLQKFERLAAALGEGMRVWVAWKDGEPAASSIVLQGANASYTRGAMDKALAGPTSANDLLQWLAIEDACRSGCRWYHLGESGRSRGLAEFKEKWGARPVPYSEYRFERLPLTRADGLGRGMVKRALRFRDA
jgi:GNAT acetyltransferase-like protein